MLACPFESFLDSRLGALFVSFRVALLRLGRTRHAPLAIISKNKKEGCLVHDSLRSLPMQKFGDSMSKLK